MKVAPTFPAFPLLELLPLMTSGTEADRMQKMRARPGSCVIGTQMSIGVGAEGRRRTLWRYPQSPTRTALCSPLPLPCRQASTVSPAPLRRANLQIRNSMSRVERFWLCGTRRDDGWHAHCPHGATFGRTDKTHIACAQHKHTRTSLRKHNASSAIDAMAMTRR